MRLKVGIEINGKFEHIGNIDGNNYNDACFSYDNNYLKKKDSRSISLSLPLKEKTFDSIRTKNFFDGLLPEGFIRRSVAEELQVDINDYLSILNKLGKECLGAIKIINDDLITSEGYKLLDKKDIYNLAHEGTTMSAELVTKAHLSLTGASGKVGLYYDEDNKRWYLPTGDLPSTHIVKQSHVRLKKIVTNEQLCLLTAKYLGFDVPNSFIINVQTKNDEEVLFVTKRYDRKITNTSLVNNGLKVPYRLHQEDFAQGLGISSMNKYETNNEQYLKKVINLIRNNFYSPLNDVNKMWNLCIFNYLIGNTDNHVKNISMIYSEDLKRISLAPIYDIVCTTMYEDSSDNFAYSINGKYNINSIDKNDFEKEAINVGLMKNAAMKQFDLMVANFKEALNKAKDVLIVQGYDNVELVANAILKSGGIKNFI